MAVSESVVFANFAQNISITNLRIQERLLKLESFLFDAIGHVDLWVGPIGGEKIFACQAGWLGHTDERQHTF